MDDNSGSRAVGGSSSGVTGNHYLEIVEALAPGLLRENSREKSAPDGY